MSSPTLVVCLVQRLLSIILHWQGTFVSRCPACTQCIHASQVKTAASYLPFANLIQVHCYLNTWPEISPLCAFVCCRYWSSFAPGADLAQGASGRSPCGIWLAAWLQVDAVACVTPNLWAKHSAQRVQHTQASAAITNKQRDGKQPWALHMHPAVVMHCRTPCRLVLCYCKHTFLNRLR